MKEAGEPPLSTHQLSLADEQHPSSEQTGARAATRRQSGPVQEKAGKRPGKIGRPQRGRFLTRPIASPDN